MTPRKPREDILNGFTSGLEERILVINAIGADFDVHGEPLNAT